MKIVCRPHLKRRVKERGFPRDCPKRIYKQAKLRLFDSKTEHQIAVAKMKYAGRMRNLAISYDIIENNVEIVTIFPISEKELKNKVHSGRWIIKI